MTESHAANAQNFMRLRNERRVTLPWKRLSREGFRRWARTTRKPPIGISQYDWKPLHEGKPVPMETMEAFSEFLVARNHPKEDSKLSVIAEPCDPPAKPKSDDPRPTVTWKLGWLGLFLQLFKFLQLEREAFCRNEADLMLAAKMTFECVGWYDKKLSGNAAIRYAEASIKHTPSEYLSLLQRAWEVNEHSTLFVVPRQGGYEQRWGVNVTIPVSEEFYRRYRTGNANEFEMKAKDFKTQSAFLLCHAVSENLAFDLKHDKVFRSIASSRTTLYQVAALCPPVESGAKPHLIVTAGTAENTERIKHYGFVPTGFTHPENGKPIMELAPPTAELTGMALAKAKAEYKSMVNFIDTYQGYIEALNHRLSS